MAADAASSIDERRRARACIIQCVLDVGVDDFGDDVDDRGAGFTIAAQHHSERIAINLVGICFRLFDYLVWFRTCRFVDAVGDCRT